MADDVAFGSLSEEDGAKVTDLVAEAIEAIENEETDKVNEARAKIEQIYKDAAAKTNQEKTDVANNAVNQKPTSPEQEAAKIRKLVDVVNQATTSVIGLTSAFNGLFNGLDNGDFGSIIASLGSIAVLIGTQLVPLLGTVLPESITILGATIDVTLP